MLEIEDLTILWPNEIPEIEWEKRAYKEYFLVSWNPAVNTCNKHERCTRVINHLGPCMRYVSSFETLPRLLGDNDLSIRLRIDAKRVSLEKECQSTE